MKKARFILLLITMLVSMPLVCFASLDSDLNNNLLHKSKCIESWKRNKTTFKLYLNSNYCKQNDATAALLTVRALYESNNVKLPKNVEIHYGNGGKPDIYPFSNIPSLMK